MSGGPVIRITCPLLTIGYPIARPALPAKCPKRRDRRDVTPISSKERAMPQIAVINESTIITDAAVQDMLAAFDHQWNNDLVPVWGVDAASFHFTPKGQKPVAGSWWLAFLDNSDQAHALAYHDLTNEG